MTGEDSDDEDIVLNQRYGRVQCTQHVAATLAKFQDMLVAVLVSILFWLFPGLRVNPPEMINENLQGPLRAL